ncbi:hypothetical protein KBC75_01255 [Candidatus Shapirobacteria bacterium]|nr:hypothetical protein [Candidatus Shapirobacteria bacterium]
MNNDFQEFLNKKSDMFEVFCDCGNKYYVFVTLAGGYSVCRTCGKKHFELSCKHCESGMTYVEGRKELDLVRNSWKCVECNDWNESIPTLVLTGYQKDEIPSEVWKENNSRKLLAGWVFKLIILVVVGSYIYFNFILK